ncbi:PhzF family phenazine biosynthesis protein [Vibrio sp. Of7-15]|uniref:PhzF family phenazine biosynthesis protein n=1 Tax=Vibrio sp. Of7-15 TaxID=2724879 RepID=UPI001EF18906|nr:PhzF family phenazine biosynthesis protein [Vibrio sp. Of7-15]MCG7500091.1 PhzF family phenazine biosynthesis protein [Vibrio sp. Of7-15]
MHTRLDLDYSVTNAFTHTPLQGNPVAIFHDTEELSRLEMQSIASQLQLSETTFISERKNDGSAKVKIFTPVNELPFAGHPLMGTAGAYARRHGLKEFVFHTQKGEVPISVINLSDTVCEVTIKVPLACSEYFPEKEKLLKSLGLNKTFLPIEIYDAGARHVLVAVDNITDLHSLKPDHNILEEFENMAINCFCWNGDKIENRMFSPAYGVKEDAGTGSVVWPILQHLIKYDQFEINKKIKIEQGVLLGRRCEMFGEIKNDGINNYAELSGKVCHFSDCHASL